MEVSLVILLCCGIASGAMWAQRISIELIALRVLVESVESGTEDRWTNTDMSNWVENANREAAIWSERTAHRLGVEPDAWERFQLPKPRRRSAQ